MTRTLVLCVAVLFATAAETTARQGGDSTSTEQHRHAGHETDSALFPAREVSGTAWTPDATPMFGVHREWRGWAVMLHGNAFGQFLYEPGERHRTGGSSTRQFGSVNWGMAMARRHVGRARLGLRAMVSLEPWTVPGCGYLSLLATGEICDGDTIHDRQHPHDLFMELAFDYERPAGGSLRWQLYAGLAGEPALGPPGFPHRLSGMLNPIAPIAHHSLDATHITFGLVTGALYGRRWKAEASLFNGREPDEHRFDLDLAPLDSFSGRLAILPSERFAVQVSAGHLTEAEAQFPPGLRSSVDRATASITYHAEAAGSGFWATTAAYGINSEREVEALTAFRAVTHALMLESSLRVGERHTWFGRLEIVGKTAHDLHAHEFPDSIFTVGKLQGGYVRDLKSWSTVTAGVGGMVSLSIVPPELAARYGGRLAPGFGVFLNLRPARHIM